MFAIISYCAALRSAKCMLQVVASLVGHPFKLASFQAAYYNNTTTFSLHHLWRIATSYGACICFGRPARGFRA